MHDWCPVSLFCTRCGVGHDEFLTWDAPCFPTPTGTVFTIQARRFIEAILGPSLPEHDQPRHPDA